NQGTQSAAGFKYEVRLSTNTAISASDLLLTTGSKTGLSAGGLVSASTYVKIPTTVKPGKYYLGLRIDPANTVKESFEFNNIAIFPITVVK
ncbi:MAG: hypothetical protein KC502_16790, partial [Myxococcales bacterium]|nr:hypothetical protein [Myxococcales bacterium]